jgi:hypothetical protein
MVWFGRGAVTYTRYLVHPEKWYILAETRCTGDYYFVADGTPKRTLTSPNVVRGSSCPLNIVSPRPRITTILTFRTHTTVS